MKKLRIFSISFTVILSLLFILLGVFRFSTSYIRFIEALGDLWNSVKFYFFEILHVFLKFLCQSLLCAELCFPHINMLKPKLPGFQNVTIFGDRVFKEVDELK